MLHAGSANAPLQPQQDGQPNGQPDGQPDGRHDGRHDGQPDGQQKGGVLPNGQQEDAQQDAPRDTQDDSAGHYTSLDDVLAAAVHNVALCTCMNVPFMQCRADHCHACGQQLAFAGHNVMQCLYCCFLGCCICLLLLCHIMPMGPGLLLGRGSPMSPNGVDFSFLFFPLYCS